MRTGHGNLIARHRYMTCDWLGDELDVFLPVVSDMKVLWWHRGEVRNLGGSLEFDVSILTNEKPALVVDKGR